MAEQHLPSFKKMIMEPGYGHKPETHGLDWYSGYIADRLNGYKSVVETRDSDEAKRRAENMRTSQDYPTGFDVPRENYTFDDRLEEETPEGEEIKDTDLVPYSERAMEAAEDVNKSLPSFREMMGQESFAKKIRTVNPGYEWEDQFEIYLNANPDKRKEIEEQASSIGSLKIARQNAMNKWIEDNRPEQGYFQDESGKGYYNPKTGYHEYKKMPTPDGMPRTAYMSTGYNQGIEPGRGIYGVNRGPSMRD